MIWWKIPQQHFSFNLMGHTTNICWVCNSDKLNIIGGNSSLYTGNISNIHPDNYLTKIQRAKAKFGRFFPDMQKRANSENN